MGKMQNRIKITLKSDLCNGSGYSYAGIIDADVDYDEYGLPMISARRLKGCMREAAELIGIENRRSLFGERGASKAEGIFIENAYIDGYDVITQEIERVKKQNKELAKVLTVQNVLELYTNIRMQTAIEEDGIAKKNSLRCLRVIGQKNPCKEEDLCFYADIEYEEDKEEEVKKVLKAVRNIGLNRNRGLGSVQCKLDSKKQKNANEENTVKIRKCVSDKRVCISYVLKNISPLMLSGNSEGISDTYLSGKSILGKMAAAFLKISGKNADSQEFQDIFLNGKTIFTNANITFQPKECEMPEKWNDYYPAPLYLNKLKKSECFINVMKQPKLNEEKVKIKEKLGDKYLTDDGNVAKKLKSHYTYKKAEGEYDVKEVEKQIIYHHSRNGRNSEDETQLYFLEALKKGQYFKGCIYTDKEYVEYFEKMIKETTFRFGKSKSAQYGMCRLAAKVHIGNVKQQLFKYEKGTEVVVTLCSDAVFINDNGYTVKFEEVKAAIANELGIVYAENKDDMKNKDDSMIETCEITGYNTTWNLKRYAIPAIKAGSVFVYLLEKDWEREIRDDELYVGERNLEGHGRIQISNKKEMSYEVKSYSKDGEDLNENPKVEHCKEMIRQILMRKIKEQLMIDYLDTHREPVKISLSTLGRVSLMLKESLKKSKDEQDKADEGEMDKIAKDFAERIESIKRKTEKEEIRKLLWQTGLEKTDESYTVNVGKLKERSTDLAKLLGQIGDDTDKVMKNLWGDYLRIILRFEKYRKQQQEKGVQNEQENS